jgi:hypothetical protein
MIRKMIFKLVLGIIAVCCFVATAEIAVADANGVKEDRIILLRQIQELMEKKHISTLSKDASVGFEKYKTLLDKLAVATVGKELATTEIDLENTILAIAQNYKADPNLIDELIAEYGSYKGDKRMQPVVLRPRSLKDEHATERYRLAWEMLLLASETPEVRFMQRRIFEALQHINNPESVPALAEAFRLTTLKDVPQEAKIVDRQTEILATLAQRPEEKTLTAMFTCLEHVDKRCEGQAPTKTFDGYTLQQKAFRLIADPDNKGITKSEKRRLPRAKKWKAIISKYSILVESEQNKQLLEKLKAHTLPEGQN